MIRCAPGAVAVSRRQYKRAGIPWDPARFLLRQWESSGGVLHVKSIRVRLAQRIQPILDSHFVAQHFFGTTAK